MNNKYHRLTKKVVIDGEDRIICTLPCVNNKGNTYDELKQKDLVLNAVLQQLYMFENIYCDEEGA